jgi:fatty-acyl-CoA synthase
VPVAFVTRRPGSDVTAEELLAHVRAGLAGFKVPKRIVFADLPKTSTGKIQKQVLRTEAEG